MDVYEAWFKEKLMTTIQVVGRIPEEQLLDQWHEFKHEILEKLLDAYKSGDVQEREIAVRLGKGPSFVSRCLTGNQNMTIHTMHDLARAMNLRLRIELDPLAADAT
jgi:hypothetical protein